jgi:uncharacterized FlaG/YvyC family protein
MDIRNVVGRLLPVNLRKNDPVERTIKSDSATDRDANGQMPQKEPEKQPPMTDEELEQAIEHLRNLAVIKDRNLTVELTTAGNKKFVLIKEPDGKVVRRIHEEELWSLKDTKENEKGQLLRRTA